jgi:predicted GH43/DUF377 family glycosyl hydrolase
MFKWEKLGQVFDPTKLKAFDWMKEQAQNPYVSERDQFLRVYFNCRANKDKDNKSISYAGFVDLDKNNLFNILNISSKPILQLGSKGSFDEFGVMEGSIFPVGDEFYLYYCGWTRMVSVPYNWAIGLAKSIDGGETFSRVADGPVIGATTKEPFLQAGCSMIMKINSIFHLWYTSGIKWVETETKPESIYQIMHATSNDGINWNREGVPIIETVIEDEAQASPSIININNRWHMVFSYRHSVNFRNKERGYRIGYAWSEDLLLWHREDSIINFNISESGWDSEMICYPHICKIDNKVYLFYCGNDFGKKGFGVAILES